MAVLKANEVSINFQTVPNNLERVLETRKVSNGSPHVYCTM